MCVCVCVCVCVRAHECICVVQPTTWFIQLCNSTANEVTINQQYMVSLNKTACIIVGDCLVDCSGLKRVWVLAFELVYG